MALLSIFHKQESGGFQRLAASATIVMMLLVAAHSILKITQRLQGNGRQCESPKTRYPRPLPFKKSNRFSERES